MSGETTPPLALGFALFGLLFFCGYVLSAIGWKNVDDKRHRTGTAQIVGGTILCLGGVGLWGVFIYLQT